MNRKNLILMLLSVILYSPLMAQEDSVRNNKFCMFISGGTGMPLGGFHSVNGFPYGKIGSELNISVNISPLKKSIYNISIIGGFNSNAIDLQGYLNGFHSMSTGSDAIASGKFTVLSLMIGPELRLPAHWKNICFTARLSVGGNLCLYPYLSYKTYDLIGHVNSFSNYEKSTTGFGLVFDIGIGVKGKIYKRLWGTLSIDYFLANSSTVRTDMITDNSGGTSFSTFNTNASISLFSLTGGLGYRIGK